MFSFSLPRHLSDRLEKIHRWNTIYIDEGYQLFRFSSNVLHNPGAKNHQNPCVLKTNLLGLIQYVPPRVTNQNLDSSVRYPLSAKISEHLACVGFSARRLEDEHDRT